MAKPVLSDPRFFNEEAAFEYVEAQLWPEGNLVQLRAVRSPRGGP